MPASLAAHARRAHLQSQPRQQEEQAVTSRQARRASLGITGAVREDVRPPGAARACRPRRAKRGGILLTSS